MAKPVNYGFEKRQREMAKEKKKKAKTEAKAERRREKDARASLPSAPIRSGGAPRPPRG